MRYSICVYLEYELNVHVNAMYPQNSVRMAVCKSRKENSIKIHLAIPYLSEVYFRKTKPEVKLRMEG